LLHDVLHRRGAARPLLRGLARRAHRRSAHLRGRRRDFGRRGSDLCASHGQVPPVPARRLRETRYPPRPRRPADGEPMTTLAGRTLFITGASRGIGREIALRAARDGANVAIAAKTVDPHPKLAGTIHTVAAEVGEAGGKGLAIQLDVRDEESILRAVA